MNYGELKKIDSANGPGVRVSLFVSGCRNHCPGCFNRDTWDFGYGMPYTQDTEKEILEALAPGYIEGFTVLGGEPFEEENQPVVRDLLKKIHETYPEKTIWCYTGYTLEKDLYEGGRKHTEVTDELLSYLTVLVDGRFVEEQRDLTLKFRGSRNQRLLKLKNGKLEEDIS